MPLETLLSRGYAARRREMIRPDRAWPEMPPPGGIPGFPPRPLEAPGAVAAVAAPPLDTSYVCVVDRQGNAFSSSPSDVAWDTPVIPGLGICPSSRGSQGWTDPGHPGCIAPGKRPRLTPNPALALRDGRLLMPFGTPGGDVQPQAMLQAFLNIVVFGMKPQEAVEAPRFVSFSFPDSFEPHAYEPGRLRVEGRIPTGTTDALAALGHCVERWPDWFWKPGGVCCILVEPGTGLLHGAADVRRPAYAVGW